MKKFLILFSLPFFLWSKPLDFNRDVRPILSDKCFSCHGPDEHGRKADLRLDIEKNAKDSDFMAIVAGKPDESEMIFRIHSDDEDEIMPPPEIGKPLTLKEKKVLEQWIREGAVWADHWAYVDPVKNPLPKVENKSWAKHWIDHFSLSHYEREKADPAPDADPVTLIRAAL